MRGECKTVPLSWSESDRRYRRWPAAWSWPEELQKCGWSRPSEPDPSDRKDKQNKEKEGTGWVCELSSIHSSRVSAAEPESWCSKKTGLAITVMGSTWHALCQHCDAWTLQTLTNNVVHCGTSYKKTCEQQLTFILCWQHVATIVTPAPSSPRTSLWSRLRSRFKQSVQCVNSFSWSANHQWRAKHFV